MSKTLHTIHTTQQLSLHAVKNAANLELSAQRLLTKLEQTTPLQKD